MFSAMRNVAATYARVDLETKVATADPHQLIQMLFDAALVAIGRAEAALIIKDIAAKGMAISRAIDIIENGLRAALDRAQGGELAQSLDDLYSYMAQRLLMASLKNDVAGLVEVRHLLGEIKQAWASIKDTATPDRAMRPSPAVLQQVK